MNIKKICTFLVFSLTVTSYISSQAHFSSEAHEGSISKIATTSTNDSSFISAADDGFLIKWTTSDGMGEHYQISDMPVKLISRHPNGNDVCVYESDGLSINSVSVWDWRTFKRKFAKRIPDPVTSLSYSARGNYIIVATSAINGVYILNANSGEVINKPSSMPGLITLAETGNSEKTAVMYSQSGSIIYYSLVNKKEKAKFPTMEQLEQTVLFGKGQSENCFLAGIKNNTLYVIYALNGRTIAQYPASNAIIFTSKTKDEDGLYFATYDGKNYTLKKILNSDMLNQINAPVSKVMNPQAPQIIKSFTGPASKDFFTSAAKNGSTILLGSSTGNVYSLSSVPESELLSLFPMSEKMYEHIYDIASKDSQFYALTKKGIYKSTYENSNPVLVTANTDQLNLAMYNDGAVLWSKNTRKTVQYVKFNGETENLFTPDSKINTLKVFNDKIIYVQGNAEVYTYDMNTKTKSLVYTGSALQDAVIYNNSEVYVSKTSAVEPHTPIIQINLDTKETLPLKMSGTITYSLSYDNSAENSPIYGVSINYQNNTSVTKVFSFLPSESSLTNLLSINTEDANAFTALSYPQLFTNIGKTNIRSYNLEKNTNFLYTRSASMPEKIAVSNGMMCVLNKNGSISWYNVDTASVMADWYLTSDGEWVAFE